MAAMDQDVTIVDSHKREVLRTRESQGGYQPMLTAWDGCARGRGVALR